MLAQTALNLINQDIKHTKGQEDLIDESINLLPQEMNEMGMIPSTYSLNWLLEENESEEEFATLKYFSIEEL